MNYYVCLIIIICLFFFFTCLSVLRCTCWFSVSPLSVCCWHQCYGELPHINGFPGLNAKLSHDQTGFRAKKLPSNLSNMTRGRRKPLTMWHGLFHVWTKCSSFTSCFDRHQNLDFWLITGLTNWGKEIVVGKRNTVSVSSANFFSSATI